MSRAAAVCSVRLRAEVHAGSWRRVSLLLVLLASTLLTGRLAAQDEEAAVPPDLRSTELLRYHCRSTAFGIREVTLFANGTVRYRFGPPDAPRMELLELGPLELDAYLVRLSEEDPTDEDPQVEAAEDEVVEGAMVARCALDLSLPDQPAEHHTFTEYDLKALRLGRLLRVAEELEIRLRPVREPVRLPSGYEPRYGDVLRSRRGVHFRVVGFTLDDSGVELDGIDQPLRIYVRKEDLAGEFVALISRDGVR